MMRQSFCSEQQALLQFHMDHLAECWSIMLSVGGVSVAGTGTLDRTERKTTDAKYTKVPEEMNTELILSHVFSIIIMQSKHGMASEQIYQCQDQNLNIVNCGSEYFLL